MIESENNSVNRILFVGGCHIDGWRVGLEKSFVSRAVAILGRAGVQYEFKKIARYIMKNPEYLIELNKKNNYDILVLQVGNYEFSPDFKKKIRKKVTLLDYFGKKNSYGIVSEDIIEEHYAYYLDIYTRLKLLAKSIIVHILGFPYFDKHKLYKESQTLFGTIKSMGFFKVIVLSSFPCADFVQKEYRRKGNEILKDMAIKNGFMYLDVMQELQSYQNVYADIGHLNVKGHKLVGEMVGNSLLEICNVKQSVNMSSLKK